jgi:hypothetical protein
LIVYRADVLRFLAIDSATGKHQVAGSHEVKLPDAGAGNSVPSTAGASLVIVYRDSVGWVRVDGTSVDRIDWNANGVTTDVHLQQDVTFNGVTLPPPAPANVYPTLTGFNDYNLIDLRQVGGRHNVGSRRIGAGGGSGGQSLAVGFGDVGFGDVGLR